jgi:4-amino-4-deoxy-L-arabinose transferase-like glycosyltransferase
VTLVYLPWLDADPVRTSLEALRLVSAREMMARGDWVVPTIAGTTYLSKPPLHYWTMMLVSLPVGGVTVVTGRLVSVLAVFATLGVVAAWGRRELGARAGLLAALIVGLSITVLRKGMRAELEIVLVLWTTLSVAALWRAFAEPRHGWAWSVASGVALGAAVLTKGPVPLLVFASAFVGLLAGGGTGRRRVLVAGAVALVVACVSVLPWVGALLARFDPAALRAIVDAQLLQRIEEASQTNVEPFWFYPPALLAGLLPWTLLAPGLTAVRRPPAPDRPRERALWFLLLGWGVGTLVVLSFSSGKESRYLLPSYPAWALLLAWGWSRRGEIPGLARYGRVLLGAVLALGLALPVAVLALAASRPADRGLLIAVAAVLLVGRLLVAGVARPRRPVLALAGLALFLLGIRGLWAAGYERDRARLYPYREVGRAIARELSPDEPIAFVGRAPAALVFHAGAGRRVIELDDWGAVRTCVADGSCGARALLVEDRDAAEAAASGARVLRSWQTRRESLALVRLP